MDGAGKETGELQQAAESLSTRTASQGFSCSHLRQRGNISQNQSGLRRAHQPPEHCALQCPEHSCSHGTVTTGAAEALGQPLQPCVTVPVAWHGAEGSLKNQWFLSRRHLLAAGNGRGAAA